MPRKVELVSQKLGYLELKGTIMQNIAVKIYDPVLPSAPLFELIGREHDLVRIKRQLRGLGNAALTVLHGLPGVGKTALAVTIAHDSEIRAYFPDGILWVGAGPHPDLLNLLGRWARLLGITATQMASLHGMDEWASAVRVAIGQRQMLVIIDDVWQYEDVQALRVGGPNCAHLVTTRFPTIAAELVGNGAMPISELDMEQSLQLLHRLAPQIESTETKLVEDLAQAVGGLPLALTLLGNYLRKQENIPLAYEHLQNIEVRLQISEPHTHAESHPSLPDTTSLSLQSLIAVTDQMLPAPAQAALYALSIFPPKPNTFSEEVALTATSYTTDELDALSDAGLLEYIGERYTLHQIIADYARIHLYETEEHEAYSRLIAYIADYVEVHRKDYELLDPEHHIISIALSKADTLGKQHELIRVVCAFAPFLILRGFYQEAKRHLQRANQVARALNDDNGITATLLYLGEIEQRLGNYAQAECSLQEGLTLARQMNNIERICALLTQLGLVFQEQGNFQQAETAYQEGLTLARNSADNGSICTLLSNLGSLNMRRSELTQSENYLQEGLALARKIKDREHVGGLLRMLGALELYRGNFVQAQSYLQEGLIVARHLGDSEQICALLNNLGLVAAQQGNNVQAKIYYQEGLELARQIGHRERICHVLINLGDSFVEEENYVQAEHSFQEGLGLARQIGHREWVSILLLNLGMTARKQDHYDEAKSYLQESLALANQMIRPRIICVVLYELGSIALSEGNTADEAYEAFSKMRDLIPPDDQELLALVHYGLARVYAFQGDRENARFFGDKSLTIFETMGHRQAIEVREWIKSRLD